jgi:hypothetical protein
MMEFGDLKYDGHDHMSIIESLFEINKDLKLLGEEVGGAKSHPQHLKGYCQPQILQQG